MFAIFSGNELVGFWGNKRHDDFLDNTLAYIKNDLNKTEPISVLYFNGVASVPEHYMFDSENNLQILNKIIAEDESISYEVALTIPKEVVLQE